MEPGVEVLVGPDGAVTRRRERVPVRADEPGGQKRRGSTYRAREHRGPEDRVVLDDIPADDVDYLAAVVGPLVVPLGAVALLTVDLPDRFPVVLVVTDALGVLFRRGDVLDWRVDPAYSTARRRRQRLRDGRRPVHVPRDTESCSSPSIHSRG